MKKMDDIDFIKGCVPFADFYEIKEYPKCTMLSIPCFEHDNFIGDYFNIVPDYVHSHFLTRTIEGINRKSFQEIGRFEIRTYRWGISIQDNLNMLETALPNHDHQDIDTAKRSAIEYVLMNSP